MKKDNNTAKFKAIRDKEQGTKFFMPLEKKAAFTLAEVLITLGVIGIIAILTIPSTVKNYKNKLYVSQLKKVYSQLTDATTSMVNDEHANNFYETTGGVKNSCSDADKGTCEKGPGYFLTTYLKNIKVNCKTGTKTCLANTYNSADGNEIRTVFGDYCVQTTNGASICMAYDEESNFDKILVDVNGTSEPNIIGKDVFVMKVKTDGSITDLSSDEDDCNKGSTDDEDARTDVEKYASGCLTKVINAGWQINDDEQKEEEEEPSGD